VFLTETKIEGGFLVFFAFWKFLWRGNFGFHCAIKCGTEDSLAVEPRGKSAVASHYDLWWLGLGAERAGGGSGERTSGRCLFFPD
jgi:hypothetical protein